MGWDADYTRGIWDYLRDNLEVERFQTVAEKAELYSNDGAILEVGCGEGILQSRMRRPSYTKYLGIDISKVAITRAAHLCNEFINYSYADMERFEPQQKFDLIIFNESLYYAKDPISLLLNYAGYLESDGHIILSIYETEENRKLMNSIHKTYALKDQQISTNTRGTWHCLIYQRQSIILPAKS
ncbi:hypothetical protein TH53_06910 [Pedobacter lusitanus]|uniref:Class I SAM-dependent methyltransferase n=2 Tax=Pedobacter lusitanus TaxID=1503925 RepID=A0A0D0GP18_9SPHI|nr:hypothetical protein TH53_06910 [Pedobacter lusitanus]